MTVPTPMAKVERVMPNQQNASFRGVGVTLAEAIGLSTQCWAFFLRKHLTA